MWGGVIRGDIKSKLPFKARMDKKLEQSYQMLIEESIASGVVRIGKNGDEQRKDPRFQVKDGAIDAGILFTVRGRLDALPFTGCGLWSHPGHGGMPAAVRRPVGNVRPDRPDQDRSKVASTPAIRAQTVNPGHIIDRFKNMGYARSRLASSWILGAAISSQG